MLDSILSLFSGSGSTTLPSNLAGAVGQSTIPQVAGTMGTGFLDSILGTVGSPQFANFTSGLGNIANIGLGLSNMNTQKDYFKDMGDMQKDAYARQVEKDEARKSLTF